MPTYHFTRVSMNRKTGPIPVTTTSSDSCPGTCSFKGNGCYAEGGPLALHWRGVDKGERGGTFEELLTHIKQLPRNQLWRHNQAGDLPPHPTRPNQIDLHAVLRLAAANKGRRGFTYTHYPPTPGNRQAVRAANASGFTVSWSAESLEQADALAALGDGPVVTVLPIGAKKTVRTPQGRAVMVCPASEGKTDCVHCGICSQANRKVIVGFPAHGMGAKRVQAVFLKHEQLELID